MKKYSLLLTMLFLVFMTFTFALACNEVEEYDDVIICGNGHLDGGEVCDGEYFRPGYSDCRAYNADKTWLSGTPRCSDDCQIVIGTCVEQVQ
ncbi:MAG: hypothetical protein ACOX8U_01525 [Bradymonadia bacterium]|jgi:hypothetical protein